MLDLRCVLLNTLGYRESFHTYIDLSTFIQGDVEIASLQRHSFQLGSGEVLKGRMHVVSDNGELDWTFSSTRCSQCVTAASLKVISQSVECDVVRISIHTAGGRCKTEAAFYSTLDLTNLIVGTLHWAALYTIISCAATLLHTLSLHNRCSFLQGKGAVDPLWKWISECDTVFSSASLTS